MDPPQWVWVGVAVAAVLLATLLGFWVVKSSRYSFRCLTKPIYRWAFRKGRQMTAASINRFL